MAIDKDLANRQQQAAADVKPQQGTAAKPAKPKKELLDDEERSEGETFRNERSPAELELEESSKGSSDSLSPNKGVPGWTNR